MRTAFRKFAERVDLAMGRPWAFLIASMAIVCWAATGPLFGFSEQWQLVVNSMTTIVTFLMVFIIQNTQERDFKSVQLKLDALLNAAECPRGLVGLQNLSDEDLQRLERVFRQIQGSPDITKIVRSLEDGAASSAKRTNTECSA